MDLRRFCTSSWSRFTWNWSSRCGFFRYFLESYDWGDAPDSQTRTCWRYANVAIFGNGFTGKCVDSIWPFVRKPCSVDTQFYGSVVGNVLYDNLLQALWCGTFAEEPHSEGVGYNGIFGLCLHFSSSWCCAQFARNYWECDDHLYVWWATGSNTYCHTRAEYQSFEFGLHLHCESQLFSMVLLCILYAWWPLHLSSRWYWHHTGNTSTGPVRPLWHSASLRSSHSFQDGPLCKQ